MKFTATILAVLFMAAGLVCAQPVRPIQTLIITGQDKHPWREATPYLRGLLEQTGRFEARVTEEFRGSTLETLLPYDLVILVYSDEKLAIQKWSNQTRDALTSFVSSGHGLVIYHHSAASFQDWPEFGKLAGCVWRTGESHHAPVHDYMVNVRDEQHPIMRGIATFMAKTDELYAGLKCDPASPIHVLATGWDDHSLYIPKPREIMPTGPSRDEPLLWTLNYGAGRVFATMLGNDMRAVHTSGFISTFVRGAEWAATTNVTIPIPSELMK